VTAIQEPTATTPGPRPTTKGRVITKWLSSTDHKVIGHLYLITSFIFFLIGGIMALIMRAELAQPGLQFTSNEQFNQLFTMHGTIMLLMFATPLFAGFANELMPLQIGAPHLPAPQHGQLLAVPVRRPDRVGWLLHP
jgi:cytochrome c oxidase subunit 1